MLKLYVVVRSDLYPSQQAVQGMHAVADLAVRFPGPFKEWQKKNNTIVFLQVENWQAVARLAEQARDGDINHVVFSEPDALPAGGVWISHSITAIAFLPNWQVQYVMLKDLPLALPVEKRRKRWG